MSNINKLGNKFSLTLIALTLGVLMFAGNLFAKHRTGRLHRTINIHIANSFYMPYFTETNNNFGTMRVRLSSPIFFCEIDRQRLHISRKKEGYRTPFRANDRRWGNPNDVAVVAIVPRMVDGLKTTLEDALEAGSTEESMAAA